MSIRRVQLAVAIVLLLAACALVSTSAMAPIDAGSFVVGSSAAERRWAYDHSPPFVRQQGWYDAWELSPRTVTLARFAIDPRPVTQAEYAAFVAATGHRAPWISAQAYQTQGFLVHPYASVKKYLWAGKAPPAELRTHPVVLVSRADAQAYCAWKGRRLPSELEWEAACRGEEGRRFPWGNSWRPELVHIQATGTAAVRLQKGAPARRDGLEMLGNVFEWTSSDFDAERASVKGCSWDDSAGSCRCGFRHGRPPAARHILIGFRCAESR